MISLDAFGSESVAADLLPQVRWRNGGSRRIKAYQKIAPHRVFQLRRELYRKPGREAIKHAVKATF